MPDDDLTRPAAERSAAAGVDPAQPAAERAALRAPVRRTPRLRPFLGTGAVLGIIVGVLIDLFGPGCSVGVPGATGEAVRTCGYQESSTLAYFVVLGALVGVGVAAILAALIAGRQGKG